MPSYEHKQQAPADLSVFCVNGCSAMVGFVYDITAEAAGYKENGGEGLKNCQAQVKNLQQSTLTFMRA